MGTATAATAAFVAADLITLNSACAEAGKTRHTGLVLAARGEIEVTVVGNIMFVQRSAIERIRAAH